MEYFKNIKNFEDLKSQYRKLAFIHHPDVGGDIEAMKKVNSEYDGLFTYWQRIYNTISKSINTETAESTRSKFYTENGWKGKNYNINLSTKEVTGFIREYVKMAYPDYKFSVSCEYYSGGSSINVSLMEAPHNIYKTSNVPKDGYIQTAEYYYKINRTPNNSNPYELTEKIIEVLKDVQRFMSSYNMNDCDGMIDYFNVNFYDHLSIGKWNKPFKVVEKIQKVKIQKVTA